MANPQDSHGPNGGNGFDGYYGSPQDFEDMWSSSSNDLNETTEFNPFNSDTQLGPAAQQPQPAQPAAPQSGSKSNTVLYAAIGVISVLILGLALVIGVMVTGSDSEDADQSPQSPDTVAAGESSSSTAAPAPTETYTETQTYTETATSEPEPAAPSTTRQKSSSKRSGFDMSRNTYGTDFDESGWIGNSARCSSGYYARILAETTEGWIVICENSSNRQQRYYVGHFGDISENPDPYSVVSYSTNEIIAKNGGIEYVLTPSEINVYNAYDENIFQDNVIDWGVLQAG